MKFERTISRISDGNDDVETMGEIIREKEIVELTENEAEQMINHYLIHDGVSNEGKWERLKDVGTVTETKKEVVNRES